jgi:asparagine synthase (glutamine-hydrolysing)
VNVQVNCLSIDRAFDENSRTEILTWEGRLDNRDDLVSRLRDLLHADTSDQALTLAAYQHWGTSGLLNLIGDWSLVIRDVANRKVILASDVAGVRPLYYHVRGGKLWWAARLQALVEAARIDEIDEQYVAGFLTLSGRPNRTPYAGIYSVPPGHALCVSESGTTVQRFWNLPTRDSICYSNENRYEEQLRALFQEAVAVRLRTDGPVMAELSGGLDSSSVVCMANRLMRMNATGAPGLTPVSYVWKNSLDESFVREVERFCQLDGIHYSTHDHPLIMEAETGGAVPSGFECLYKSVSVAADRAGAKVFLTGYNGDLAMGNWFDDSVQVAKPLRRFRIGQACKDAYAWSKLLRIPVSWVLWRAVQATLPGTLGVPSQFSMGDGSPIPNDTGTLLLPGFSKRTGLCESGSWFSNSWLDAPPERRKHFQALTMLLELRALQAPETLQHLDYTHPFAHRPLVEFTMALPPEVLCGPGEPRKLMRRALADLWPVKLRARRSKGAFNSPWLEALRPLARLLLRAPQIEVVERGFVNRARLLSSLERLCAGVESGGAELRQIIVLEFWLRRRSQMRVLASGLQAA